MTVGVARQGFDIDSRPDRASGRGGATFDDVEPHKLGYLWTFAGELAFDFRKLTAAQTRRIAPFVIEAAWRRGLGPLLLLHGGRKPIAMLLRKQLRAGDWMAWAYCSTSKRHATSATRLLVGLRPDPSLPRTPLPSFEPGCEDFDAPRCVGWTKDGRPCRALARPRRLYCAQHDPRQGET